MRTPEMHLSEQAAEDLVDESGYFDKEHARKSLTDFIDDAWRGS